MGCELPSENKLPLSRFSCADIAREAVERGIVARISGATVWRWLSKDAIKPWRYRTWIFPRDPQFRAKAERVLDLYHGVWEGKPLGDDEYVLSADEKTSIQARKRCHDPEPPAPKHPQRVEFEYERHGALAYMAVWDVRRARLFGRCEQTTGIDAYHRLVDLVMHQDPYRSAKRVFWITDNGSSHRGTVSIERLAKWHPNAVQVHTPVHASWLNQVEIYFSIVQRKALTPADFDDLQAVQQRLLDFQTRYEQQAKPFEWKFSRDDLDKLLHKLKLDDDAQQQEADAA